MAKYTMTVYELEQSGFDFGLDKYTIFDEEYRPILNRAILDFYKFREIGFQNPWLWRDRLMQRMDLLMRNKYNDLYLVKKTEFNPLFNVDMTETFSHEVTNTNNAQTTGTQTTNNTITNTNTNTNSNLALSSQYPSEEMTENDLTSNIFVDVANKNNGDSTTTDSGTNNTDMTIGNTTDLTGKTLESYTRKTLGSSAGLSFSHAMLQFKAYLDKYEIDQQLIAELKDLFMLIW